jgi:hypothetical protein
MREIRHYCTFKNWSSEFRVWMYLDHVLTEGEILKMNTSSNNIFGDWKVTNVLLVRTSSNARTATVYEVDLDRI